MDEFETAKSAEYQAVIVYLNTIELICVGINQKVSDQRVCYGYWMDILKLADAMPVIQYHRVGDQKTYEHILAVSRRWNGRHWIWQRWRRT